VLGQRKLTRKKFAIGGGAACLGTRSEINWSCSSLGRCGSSFLTTMCCCGLIAFSTWLLGPAVGDTRRHSGAAHPQAAQAMSMTGISKSQVSRFKRLAAAAFILLARWIAHAASPLLHHSLGHDPDGACRELSTPTQGE
jgi:hypothetical protein